MSKHYTDDLHAGGATQLHPNIEQGGIVVFDCNEVIAECAENGESHQIHLNRHLTDAELNEIDRLSGNDGDYCDDEPDSSFLNLGQINTALRVYLLSLRA